MAEPQPSPKSNDPLDQLIGRTINDRFEVQSLIARGGMGRVYRAKQQPLGRLVAIKVLDPRQAQTSEDQDFQTRFFLEASTAARLSHPNTVTVFDYGKTDDGIFYIVMELVEGKTLAKVLSDNAPLEPARAVHIAAQIARSLREAHGLGVIHRDLKPANVLITKHGDEDDFAKVLDFGLVKDVTEDVEMTQAGTFMGSPKYMAPEQIQGTECDGRTDIYALGCILYYMLVGRVPFDRENQVQILMAHCREAPPPMIRDDGVAIPQGLVQVTLRCLAKEREQRFANMNDLIAAMRHAVDGSGLGSASTALGRDLNLSGMRSIGVGTPSGGFPVGLTPSGGIASGLDSSSSLLAEEMGRSVEPPQSRTGLYAIVLLAAVAIGGGSAWYSMQAKKEAAARAEAQRQAEVAAQAERDRQAQQAAAAAAAAAANEQRPDLERVQIVLSTDPGGAQVFVDERVIGTTPLDIEWVGDQAHRGREVVFRFVKDNYRPLTVTRVITSERIEIDSSLEALPRVSAPAMTVRVEGPEVRRSGYRDNPF